MKYKRFVYTHMFLLITILKLVSARENAVEYNGVFDRYNDNFKWKKSPETFHRREAKIDEEFEEARGMNFPSEISNCIVENQQQITQNFTQGRNIILNCFKASLMLNVLKYLGDFPRNNIKLFNGMLEFKKIPQSETTMCDEEDEYCKKYKQNFEKIDSKKSQYIRMYKKAMQRLINERKKLNAFRNQTEEEKANQLNRIEENSQAFLTEVLRNLGDENLEKAEEERLKQEITDPKLLSVLDAFSKNYMLKLRFYPGIAARMMRSNNGGFTFDLEIQDSSDDEEVTSDESSTREIKDGPQAKDYFDDDDDDDGGNRRKQKKGNGNKKKQKEKKKKAKKLKKVFPYLLIPILIQASLLPFVFKKLFFLAMKALFAGKVALILVGFNLLRNTCIKNDDYQKIRVEHYGYRRGEEYGAWINGRSLQEPLISALSEEPFRGQKPVTA